jgi:hypothetical protein
MALPELQAWSALIEKTSGGKAHGGLLEYDPVPRKLNGKSYWQFSYVENSAESALRWEASWCRPTTMKSWWKTPPTTKSSAWRAGGVRNTRPSAPA